MFVEHKEAGELTRELQTLEPWRELMLKAADLIEKHGHAKGSYTDARGGYCFMGALHVAETGDTMGTNGLSSEACHRVMKHIGSRGFIDWNDAPERTGAEVVGIMRRVALGG